jgi:hypothetical protein
MDETPKPNVCYRHPDRETYLRCNRCERLICMSCAIKTPTGYSCPDCVRGQQKKFDTAKPVDYISTIIVTVILSYLGSFVAGYLGYFVILLAPVIGGIIAEIVRRIIGGRRAKRLFQAAVAACIVGSIPLLLMNLLGMNLFGLLFQGIYIFIVSSTLYYRLRGIQL